MRGEERDVGWGRKLRPALPRRAGRTETPPSSGMSLSFSQYEGNYQKTGKKTKQAKESKVMTSGSREREG